MALQARKEEGTAFHTGQKLCTFAVTSGSKFYKPV